MGRLSLISFHPKFVAVIDALIGLLMLWWIKEMGSWWMVGIWLGFRAFFWFCLIRLMYYPGEVSRWRHLASLLFFNAGMLGFLLFIDWSPFWNVAAVVYIFTPFVSFWVLPSSGAAHPALFKPHRRWRFIMALIAVAGMFEAMGALLLFQMASYEGGKWVWMIAFAAGAAALAAWWWQEYGIKIFAREALPQSVGDARSAKWRAFLPTPWLLAFFVFMLELEWVFYLLPLGYQTNSLALTLLWYILWVLARFHLSPGGINWSKQRWHLAAALVFFLVFFVFIVRWK